MTTLLPSPLNSYYLLAPSDDHTHSIILILYIIITSILILTYLKELPNK